MSLYLSKSLYCQAIQCPKMLWLAKNKPETFDKDSIDEGRIEEGKKVGKIAQELFENPVVVDYNPEKIVMIQNTKSLISEGQKVICEASFASEGLFCSVDVLVNIDGYNVEIYEVKSSTKLKDEHYDDVSYQAYVLNKCGYKVVKACVVHIDSSYVRHGELELDKLFCVADITGDVLYMQDIIEDRIAFLEEYMQSEEEPVCDLSCSCFSPYDCGYWKYCSKHLPSPNVFDVTGRMPVKKKVELYKSGLVSFEQLYNSGVLSSAARLQVSCEIENKPYVNKLAIKDFVSQLTYPIYFLDFETVNFAIPAYDNSKPYMQIPFQYSLHYIESEGGELKHKEFLAEHGKDPRRELAERLCADIPMNVCVTAYNMSFEKTRIKELAAIYTDLEEHLMNIYDNIYDLMIPFSQKEYYLKEMRGSYSIKYVLPALCPDDPALNYANLEDVHNGVEASHSFAVLGDMDEDERERIRKNLLEYCKLDTFAMVKVWEKLKEFA